MITKNGRDLPIEQITAENYIVPKGEEYMYHAKIELFQTDTKGIRLSRPNIQKFGMKMWKRLIYDNLVKQGYTIEVLHDPEKYIREKYARKQATPVETTEPVIEKEEAPVKAETPVAEAPEETVKKPSAKKAGRPRKTR